MNSVKWNGNFHSFPVEIEKLLFKNYRTYFYQIVYLLYVFKKWPTITFFHSEILFSLFLFSIVFFYILFIEYTLIWLIVKLLLYSEAIRTRDLEHIRSTQPKTDTVSTNELIMNIVTTPKLIILVKTSNNLSLFIKLFLSKILLSS